MRPLRRSRARFPLLSPTVTSSPGAGEVFPLRGSQAITFVAKVLGAMRKLPAVLLALPLGELSPKVTERAHAVSPIPPQSAHCVRSQIPLFVTYGDIFPRSGGSHPSRGRLWAMPETLPPPPKAVPLGKVASPQAMTEGVTSGQPALRFSLKLSHHRQKLPPSGELASRSDD